MTNTYYSKEQIERIVNSFVNQKLSKTDWTHDAHLIVALWFLTTYEFNDAICKLRSGIILLNKSHQTDNTGHGGYHETLTIFWSKIISTFIKVSKSSSIESLINTFLNSSLADKQLPFKFYDKEKVLSSEFRAIYYKEYKLVIDESSIQSILKEQIKPLK